LLRRRSMKVANPSVRTCFAGDREKFTSARQAATYRVVAMRKRTLERQK
jgi:hypothetical protein